MFFVLNVMYSHTILTRILSHNLDLLNAISDMTQIWGMAREKAKFNKSRPSNITISEHSQEIQELHIFCKILALYALSCQALKSPGQIGPRAVRERVKGALNNVEQKILSNLVCTGLSCILSKLNKYTPATIYSDASASLFAIAPPSPPPSVSKVSPSPFVN